MDYTSSRRLDWCTGVFNGSRDSWTTLTVGESVTVKVPMFGGVFDRIWFCYDTWHQPVYPCILNEFLGYLLGIVIRCWYNQRLMPKSQGFCLKPGGITGLLLHSSWWIGAMKWQRVDLPNDELSLELPSQLSPLQVSRLPGCTLLKAARKPTCICKCNVLGLQYLIFCQTLHVFALPFFQSQMGQTALNTVFVEPRRGTKTFETSTADCHHWVWKNETTRSYENWKIALDQGSMMWSWLVL